MKTVGVEFSPFVLGRGVRVRGVREAGGEVLGDLVEVCEEGEG